MSMLINIGNSQGVRIPKPIIKQAHLADVELEFVVIKDGLLIKPIETPSREVWAKNIQAILKQQNREDEALLEEMLNDSDLEDLQW
jgi:antitoxin MazE